MLISCYVCVFVPFLSFLSPSISGTLCTTCTGTGKTCTPGISGGCTCNSGYLQNQVDASCYIPCYSSSDALAANQFASYRLEGNLLNSVTAVGAYAALQAVG